MRILLDENTTSRLVALLAPHEVRHVLEEGLDALQNGALLAEAEMRGFDVLITLDKRMHYQQNLKVRKTKLLVVDIHPTDPHTQQECADKILVALDNMVHSVTVVEGPHPKRDRKSQ